MRRCVKPRRDEDSVADLYELEDAPLPSEQRETEEAVIPRTGCYD